MKEYIKIISLSLIPTLLVFIGRSDSFFDFLKAHEFIKSDADISTPQITCFTIGILWAGLITPIQLAKTKNKLEEKEKNFNELLEVTKDAYFKSLKENLKKYSASFKTRIFVPEKGIKAFYRSRIKKVKNFKLKEVAGLTDRLPVKNLSFEVEPQCQGLVGKAYKAAQNKQNTIIVDCNVNADESNLTAYQKSKTADVKFCSTAPIYDKNSKVIAILSVDSNETINFDEAQTQLWKENIIYYCALIDKHTNL